MLEVVGVVLAYFIGSIPFGLILARVFCKTDPQTAGSGNIGATNVTRLCGLPVGISTLLLDAGKGFAAVYLASHFFIAPTEDPGYRALFLTCTGLAVILGHMHPVFLKFKGGKAVATTIGVFSCLALPQTLIAISLCVLVIAWKKYVSLGSLVLVLSLPFILLISGDVDLLILSIAVAFLVSNAHKPNIKRLLSGEEKPWRTPKNK